MTQTRVWFTALLAIYILPYAMPQQEPEARNDLQRLTESIIADHKRMTDVQYPDLVPIVRIVPDGTFGPGFAAQYFLLDRTIWVKEGVQQGNFSNRGATLQRALSHELGHFLTDNYIQRYARDSWLEPLYEQRLVINDDTKRTVYGIMMVNEGIGEYFESFYGRPEVKFPDSIWDREMSPGEFESSEMKILLFYEFGYTIVKPIMDARGAHEGLLWLLRNELVILPPNLSVVKEYKARGVAVGGGS